MALKNRNISINTTDRTLQKQQNKIKLVLFIQIYRTLSQAFKTIDMCIQHVITYFIGYI